MEKMKALFAFPLAFLLGVLVKSLLQLFQVSSGATTMILVVGLPLLFLSDHFAGRAGNSAIVRGFAKFMANPEETRARIDAAEKEDAKTSFFCPLIADRRFCNRRNCLPDLVALGDHRMGWTPPFPLMPGFGPSTTQ